VLTFHDDLGPADVPLLAACVELMMAEGIAGFVFDLTGFRSASDPTTGLSYLGLCLPVIGVRGGVLNWLRGSRFVDEWKRLHLLGVPPENFESEEEAVEGLRTILESQRLRKILPSRLGPGVSLRKVAAVAGVFESDVRKVADGRHDVSDAVVLKIASALGSMNFV
jgi:hypothetical protein